METTTEPPYLNNAQGYYDELKIGERLFYLDKQLSALQRSCGNCTYMPSLKSLARGMYKKRRPASFGDIRFWRHFAPCISYNDPAEIPPRPIEITLEGVYKKAPDKFRK